LPAVPIFPTRRAILDALVETHDREGNLRMKNRIALALCAALIALTLGTQDAESARDSRISPYLLFQDGRAEEAMEFYVGLFDDGEILRADKYGPGQAGKEGTIYLGVFEIAGQRVMCTESPPIHEFDFTPSVSLFVECADAEEIARLTKELGDGGETMMPLGEYGFSEKFAWVQDRYGVSWQLCLGLN